MTSHDKDLTPDQQEVIRGVRLWVAGKEDERMIRLWLALGDGRQLVAGYARLPEFHDVSDDSGTEGHLEG